MTTKHTPGPWRIGDEGAGSDWAIVTDAFGSIVANVNAETGPDAISAPATRKMPRDANARLIAEAPAMAEILARLAVLPDHSPEWLENPSVRVDFRMAVTTARAILARIDNPKEG